MEKKFDLTEGICDLVYEGWNDSKKKLIEDHLTQNGFKPAKIEKIIYRLGDISEDFHDSRDWNAAGDRASKKIDRVIAGIQKKIEKAAVK